MRKQSVAELAVKARPVLEGYARAQSTVTYGAVAAKIGTHPRVMGAVLDELWDTHPRAVGNLTALVTNKRDPDAFHGWRSAEDKLEARRAAFRRYRPKRKA